MATAKTARARVLEGRELALRQCVPDRTRIEVAIMYA